MYVVIEGQAIFHKVKNFNYKYAHALFYQFKILDNVNRVDFVSSLINRKHFVRGV
jgi:hypothetical protein